MQQYPAEKRMAFVAAAFATKPFCDGSHSKVVSGCQRCRVGRRLSRASVAEDVLLPVRL
jgi:hypothetical protein